MVWSNVFIPEKSSISTHFGFNLEFNSVAQRLSWVILTLDAQEPSLIVSIMAIPPSQLLFVSILTSPNIKTFSSNVSDISPWSIVPSNSLWTIRSPLSHYCRFSNSQFIAILVWHDKSSIRPSSNCMCPWIKDKPLSIVGRLRVSNS